jgi:hypothetical protein
MGISGASMKLPRISRVSRRWKQLGITVKVAVLGLAVAVVSVLVAVVGLVPSFLSLADDGSGAVPLTSASSSSPPPSRSSPPATTTTTSARTSTTVSPTTQPAVLKVDAGYSWTTDSIIWAFAKPLPSEDGQAVERPKLGGDAAAQQQLEDRLAKRGGIKIGVDSSGDPRPHSEVRLLVTGQHDGAVLITGMRANVTKRSRPLAETLVFGPAEGEGGNIQIGFDLDALRPVARSYDCEDRRVPSRVVV